MAVPPAGAEGEVSQDPLDETTSQPMQEPPPASPPATPPTQTAPPAQSPPIQDDPIQQPAPVPPPPPPTLPPKPPGTRSKDPLLQFQFAVEFNFDPFGLLPPIIPITGYFTEISGLNVEWEMTEYKTTNFLALPNNNQVIGRPVYQPVTLRRGVTGSETFWLWHQLLALGTKPIMKNYVMISMYDRNYRLAAQWSLERAWPTKVSGPEIRADGNDIAIEELTLVHGGIMRMYLEPGMELMNILMQQMLP